MEVRRSSVCRVQHRIEKLVERVSREIGRIPVAPHMTVADLALKCGASLPDTEVSIKLSHALSKWIVATHGDWNLRVNLAVYSENGFTVTGVEVDWRGVAKLRVRGAATWNIETRFVEELLATLAFVGALDDFAEHGMRAGGVLAVLAERARLLSRVLERGVPDACLLNYGSEGCGKLFLVESGTMYVGFYIGDVAEFAIYEEPIYKYSSIYIARDHDEPLYRFPISLVEKLPVYRKIVAASRGLKKAVDRYTKCFVAANGVLFLDQ